MNREYVEGIPCKGGQDDGDSLLWGALMYASGEDVSSGILGCEGKDGAFFRSPLKREQADKGMRHINSFSRDMATGLSLAAVKANTTQFGSSVLGAYHRWVQHTLDNGCKACNDDTDGRCVMTPGVYWMAIEAGVRIVPLVYRLTKFLHVPYVYVSARFNPLGYTLHLVGVTLLSLVIARRGRSKISWLAKKAAKKLTSRQPENAFFAWLAGDDARASALLAIVKGHIAVSGQGSMRQWAWEREDAEHAWKDSCGHDVAFMENLLKSDL
jgi:hypothetical protein